MCEDIGCQANGGSGMKRNNLVIFTFLILSVLMVRCEEFKEFKTEPYDGGLVITKYTGNEKDVKIPERKGKKEIIGIYGTAFQENNKIETVFIPDTITFIGRYSFKGCSSLKSINIPDSVKEILSFTFDHCTSLISINIPDSVTEIQEAAFNNCTSLTNIYIPDSVEIIGKGAFLDCVNLKNIYFSDNLIDIGENAFKGCKSLVSIELPAALKKIGSNAFSDCISLENVSVFSSDLEYDSVRFTFNNCSNIKSVTGTGKFVTALQREIQSWTHDLYVSKRVEEYRKIENPTINDEFILNKEIFPEVENYYIEFLKMEDYLPQNANTLPVPTGGFSKTPNGKFLFINTFDYSGNTLGYAFVNKGNYYLDFYMMREFEKGLDPSMAKRFVPDDLAEVEFIVLITHRADQELKYTTIGGGPANYTVYTTNAIVDVYRINQAHDLFVKTENLGIIQSGSKSYFMNLGSISYVGTDRKNITDLVMAKLGDIVQKR